MADEIDRLLAEILVDAYNDDKQLEAFEQVFTASVRYPFSARIVGIQVEITSIAYEGERRGLVAVCRRGGDEHRVSLADITPGPVAVETVLLVGAYRRWCGLPPLAAQGPTTTASAPPYRPLADRRIALSSPLALRPHGTWDPAEDDWGEPGQDPHPFMAQIVAAGPRPAFEMEQVIPGVDDDEWDLDPVADAAELHRSGADREASRILRALIAQDERCIDAWVHLGNIVIHRAGPKAALELYDTAVAIGEQSIPSGFAGVLPWGLIDNRPFHRALYGLGLCAWRQRRWEDAEDIFATRICLEGLTACSALHCLEQVRVRQLWTKD